MDDQSMLSDTREKLHEEMEQIISPHIPLPHTPSWVKLLKDDPDILEKLLELEITDDLPKAFENIIEKVSQQTSLFALCEELGVMEAVKNGFEKKPAEMTKYAYEELVFKKHQAEVSYLAADLSGSNLYLYGAWPDKKNIIYTIAKNGMLPWELHKYIHAKIHRLYTEQSLVSKMMQAFSPTDLGIELIEVQAFRASLLSVEVVSPGEVIEYMRLATDENGVLLFPLLDVEKAAFAIHIIDSLNALGIKQKDIATMIKNRGKWHRKQYARLYHTVVDMVREKGFHEGGLRHLIHEDKQRMIRNAHIAKKLAIDELARYKSLLERTLGDQPVYMKSSHA